MTTSTPQRPHRFHDAHGHPVELSNLDFFEAADAYAENLRLYRCEAPVELPGGFQMGRCHSRSVNKCQGCASLYRGDWRSIAYSGIFDQHGEVEAGFRYYLVTLTAPSFGAVHHVPKRWDEGKPGRWDKDGCSGCYAATGKKLWHHPDRDRQKAGVPVNLDSYDYAGQVAWNNHSYELWKTYWKRIRRRWEPAGAVGFDRLAHFGVKELQARMAVHFHVVIRFAVDAAPGSPEELKVMTRDLCSTDSETGQVYVFGEQSDVQELTAQTTNHHGHRGHAAVVGYVLKALNYTIKDTVSAGGEQKEGVTGARLVQLARLRDAADGLPCARCADYPAGDCPAPKHHNYGIPSRPFLKSLNWSFTGRTRVGCREERTRHVRNVAERQRSATGQGTPSQGRAAMLRRRRASSVTAGDVGELQACIRRNVELRSAAAFQRRFRNTPVSEHGQRLWRMRC